jgi:hypothetical protein
MIVSDVLPASWRDVFSENDRRIGIGVDPATTTKKKSNPTGIAVIQQVGLSYFVRILLRFKTSDPDVTTEILRELVTGLPHTLKARRLCILATNERFYAAGLRRQFSGIVPVEMLIESEATTYLGEKMTVKSYLGNQLVNTIEDGYLPLPDEPWVKSDIRQVVRDKGTFNAEPDENGNHADGFCAIGAGLHALIARGGPAQAKATPVGSSAKSGKPNAGFKNPYYSKFQTHGAKIHV